MAPETNCRAFSLLEVLVVTAIVIVLLTALFPVIGMLKESSRHQQASRVIAQLEMGIREYASEDPAKSPPPQDGDTLIRFDPSNQQLHLLNALVAMQMDGGMQQQVIDPTQPGMRVLVDPWQRPYHYQCDAAGALDPTKPQTPVRPDPARLDWNARNLVPFGYVWSLGSPRHGHAGQWTADPDAEPGSGAPWIYSTTAPSGSP